MTTRMSPDARGLLDIALSVYRAEVLPAIPASRRYEALMIANALAIAAREFGGLDDAGRRMLDALSELCGEDGGEHLAGRALLERVEALERRLSADIAAGDYDHAETRPALMRCLDALVSARLSITNPKLAGTAEA